MVDPATTRNLTSQLEQCVSKIGFYQNLTRLRQDLQTLFFNCGTLKPNVGSFKTSSGSSITLFYLTGVVPITYSNNKYNIPVTIYFDPPYPAQPPRVFVTPTSEMVLKPNHRAVDQNGRVFLPQLSSWHPQISNLVDIIAVLSATFSTEPPVNAVKRASVVMAAAPVVVARPPGPSRRDTLLKSINAKLGPKVRQRLQSEIDSINASKVNQTKLGEYREKLIQLRAGQSQIEARSNRVLLELDVTRGETESWLASNKHQEETDDGQVKSYLEASSVVGQQAIDCMAEICAIEDLIDIIQELNREGRLTMAERLREVRILTRRLFEVKYVHKKTMVVLASVE
jgi:ESCRT-I complex subunit TSG101